MPIETSEFIELTIPDHMHQNLADGCSNKVLVRYNDVVGIRSVLSKDTPVTRIDCKNINHNYVVKESYKEVKEKLNFYCLTYIIPMQNQ